MSIMVNIDYFKLITKIQPQLKIEIINFHKKNLIYIKAPLGCFIISISFKIINESNQLITNIDKRLKQSKIIPFWFKNYNITDFVSIFQQIVIATYIGYERKLRMGGRNFNFIVENSILTVKVGLSHNLIKKLSPFFKFKSSRKYRVLRLKSTFLLALSLFISSIRIKFKRNAYTGKGIRYKGERRITKVMHKTRR